MTASAIHCTIDLEAPGKQFGVLQLPRSSNESGWSTLWIPIACVGNGDGPTALVLGGVHGDEPEGRKIVHRLRRDFADAGGVELWTVASINPDGHERRTRKNARGVDLNRNFSVGWSGAEPTARPSAERWVSRVIPRPQRSRG